MNVVSTIPATAIFTVDLTASTDPDSTLASGSLNFGDGTNPVTWTGSPPAPMVLSYSYPLPGTYTITAILTDTQGLSSATTRQILVTDPAPNPPPNQAPLAVLRFVSGQFVNAPVVLSTEGTRDPDGVIASYAFDHGDGASIPVTVGAPPLQVPHVYTTPGTFVARLTVTDGLGLQATAALTIQVQALPPPPVNVPPVAAIQQSGGLFAGDNFTFNTQGTVDQDGTITQWGVIFGDGQTLNQPGAPPATFGHVYTASGTYNGTYTVTDDDGANTSVPFTVSVLSVPVPAPSGVNWSSIHATYVIEFFKTAGEEITDLFWFHLHQGHAEAESFSVQFRVWSENNAIPNRRNIPFNELPAGHQVRYEVRGVPVTGWIDLATAGAGVTITLAQIVTAGINTGIHDLSIRVQGPQSGNFQPIPSFLHVFRTGAPVVATVPIICRNDESTFGISDYPQDGARTGPGIFYVNVADRVFTGHPVEDSPVAWSTVPYATDLYVEQMSPHANLFMPQQMWWQEPPGTVSAGLKFVRAIPPKLNAPGDARVTYSNSANPAVGTDTFGFSGQRSFPFKDGPRGVAWTSPFVTGQIDSQGGFAFVEAGGLLRYMFPDGEITTLAGWVTDPSKDPVWFLKPLDLIRQNQVLRGTWSSGQYPDNSGFRLPLDVAIDPLNENEWYVVGFYDHCIWKVVTNSSRTTATVSVFAGDPNHSYGYVDATGTAARFKGPGSLVFCPTADCLYVADQDNDCIRKITRAGVVTTLFGTTNFGVTLQGRGATHLAFETMYDTQLHNFDKLENRALSQITVSAGQAGLGVKPEIYLPYTIRVFSNGDLCVLDMGFGLIRRIKLTGETSIVSDFQSNFAVNNRAWFWADVDRWGNSGPLDGVYFCSTVASIVTGEATQRFNEVFGWVPGDGSALMRFLAGPDSDSNPDGWGPIGATDLPHYPWLVAVDPRGGLLMSGIGEHGHSRMRLRRVGDPVPPQNPSYFNGTFLWGKLSGPTTDYSVGFPTPIIKFGSNCHNILGFTDAWSLTAATDQQLLDAFGIPPAIQANPSDRATIVNFIRLNAGPV